MEDKEIVQLFTKRDETAIARASEKYGSYLMKIAENITGSHEDAEEIVNDALFKAWEIIPPHSPEKLSAFLGKLARNEAVSRRRTAMSDKRGKGEIALVLDEMSEMVPGGSNVELEHEQKELMHEISEFVRRLPSPKRELFVCRYWYCINTSELSERFGISKNGVCVTLSRIRVKLKAHLQKRGYEI